MGGREGGRRRGSVSDRRKEGVEVRRWEDGREGWRMYVSE